MSIKGMLNSLKAVTIEENQECLVKPPPAPSNPSNEQKDDTLRIEWLNGFLSYDHMKYLFGKKGVSSDDGPRDIRATIDDMMKE